MTARILSLFLSGTIAMVGSVHAQITAPESAPGMKGGHPMMEGHMHHPGMRDGMSGHMGLHQLFAGSGKHGAEMSPAKLDKMVGHWMVELNGTTEQQKKITDIAVTARSDLQTLREQMQTQREKGMDLMFSKTLDTQALDKQHAEHYQLREKIGNRMHRAMVAVLQVLTPEQREQMKHKMHSQTQGNHPRVHGRAAGAEMQNKEKPSMPAQR